MKPRNESPQAVARAELSRLLQRAGQRDEIAFQMAYQRTYAKLFKVVFAIVRNRDDVEEILQDVYIKIWRRAGDFDPSRASPISWMAIIARNAAIDFQRVPRLDTVHCMEDVVRVDDAPDTALEEHFNGRERPLVMNAFRGLPPIKQELLSRAYIHGETRQQLAHRFDVPVGTVKTWLRRALQVLQHAVASHRESEDLRAQTIDI